MSRCPAAALAVVAALVIALTALAAQSREYEIVEVDPGPWRVTARDTQTGAELSFRLDPSHFRGLTFFADLEAAQPGRRISVTGKPGVQIRGAALVAAAEGPGRGRPSASARRPAGGRERGGGQEYRVTAVDPKLRGVTAQPVAGGPAVRLEVDPGSFRGYRFEATLSDFVSGSPLTIVARNERPLADCCVVVGPGR